jgi:hypothetical protein
MMQSIRMAFLASLIVFGAALSSTLRAEMIGEEDPEEIDSERCQGTTEPICRTWQKETCERWSLCGQFEICCAKTITESRTFYFPAPN